MLIQKIARSKSRRCVLIFVIIVFFYIAVQMSGEILGAYRYDPAVDHQPRNQSINEGSGKSFVEKMIEVNLTGWVQTYISWHRTQRAELAKLDSDRKNMSMDEIYNHTKHIRFLAIVCTNALSCGGMADRLKSLPYWLIQANLTRRVLLIHWNKAGIYLDDYLIPPPRGLDWRVPKNQSTILHKLFHGRESCLEGRARIKSFKTDMNSLSEKQIVCVNDQINLLKPRDEEKYSHNNHNSYPYAFRTIFQPTIQLAKYMQKQLEVMNTSLGLDMVEFSLTEPYLAVHIRSRYPLHGPDGGWVRLSIKEHYDVAAYLADHAVETVIEKYRENNGATAFNIIPPVYVASDSADIIRYLQVESPQFGAAKNGTIDSGQSNVPQLLALDVHENRSHINFMNYTAPSDVYNVFFDLWMLSNSKCIAYGIGGFGKMASSVSISAQDCQVNYQVPGRSYTKVSLAAAQYWGKKNLSSHFYKMGNHTN